MGKLTDWPWASDRRSSHQPGRPPFCTRETAGPLAGCWYWPRVPGTSFWPRSPPTRHHTSPADPAQGTAAVCPDALHMILRFIILITTKIVASRTYLCWWHLQSPDDFGTVMLATQCNGGTAMLTTQPVNTTTYLLHTQLRNFYFLLQIHPPKCS